MSQHIVKSMTQPLAPGDKVGYFEVVEQVAAGGMGIVFKAHDRVMGRDVAIKQLDVQLSDDEAFRERFRAEAEIQKRISAGHRNLVQIIDFVAEARGYFIVMEYVPGASLERLLSKTNESVDVLETLLLVRDAASGLAAMHAAGVIHRDLKPSNILLGRDRVVKVCDFGLATMLAEQDTLEMGTARYMAPELFASGPVDHRCDIYSLGMIAYEMLAGRSKFNEVFKTVVRDQRNESMRWMKWHTNTRVTAPPLNTLNEFVPEVLGEMVARMMAKDVTQRIPSAQVLIDTINRHFSKSAPAHAPSQAAPQGTRATASPPSPAAPGPGRQQVVHSAPPAPPRTPSAQPYPAAPVGAVIEPPTAPLPKRSKWPLVLAALIMVQLIAIGGYFGYQWRIDRQQRQAIRDQAMGQFEQGRQHYTQQRFAEAKAVFEQLAADPRWATDPVLSGEAIARVQVCQTRIDMVEAAALTADSRFEEAAAVYRKAEDALQQADDLDDTRRLQAHIKELRDELHQAASFVEAIAKVKQLVEQSDYEAARVEWRRLQRSSDKRTEAEKTKLAELGATIEAQSSKAEIDGYMARAKEHEDQQRLPEALEELKLGAERFPTSTRLRDAVAAMIKRIDYDKALDAAGKYETSGNLAEAINHYNTAQAIRSTPDVEERIRQLKARQSIIRARQLLAMGDREGAVIEFNRSLGFWEIQEAKDALGQLAASQKMEDIVRAGDTAMAAADYESAVNQYQRAVDIAADPAVQQKLNQAKVRAAVVRAQGHLQAAEMDKARAALEEALAVDPGDTRAADLMATWRLHTQYDTIIAEGDALRADQKYSQAKRKYNEALKLIEGSAIDPAEAKQRIKDTDYDWYIAQTSAAIEVGNVVQAEGYLVILRQINYTDAVKDLERRLAERKKELGK